MQIKSASYITSALDVSACPESRLPEFAVIGRSNVGKSSLINSLVGRKALARVSATPGHTQMINFFAVNDRWSLVDLPGYGFADAPEKVRAKFQSMIAGYITRRTNLARVFVLIDSRHTPQAIDVEFVTWLAGTCVPVALVFTKADKISATKAEANIALFLERISPLFSEAPRAFVTSAKTGAGRHELLSYIGGSIAD